MTSNDPESCLIQPKVRFANGTLDVRIVAFGADRA